MSSMLLVNNNVRPRSLVIAAAVINAANTIGVDVPMVITFGRDGGHRPGSWHYEDRALDFRTHHLTVREKQNLLAEVKRRLGKGYQSFIEYPNEANEHLHIEYDPS